MFLFTSAAYSFAQHKIQLDDGSGHYLTIQMPTSSVSGTLTLPSGNVTLVNTASGAVTGQTLRWNNATSQWELSPSVTNVGSTLSNAGAITATGASGNISASGTVTATSNISSTSGNVTASGILQAGTALGSGTASNGGVYTDNMIMAAGYAGLTGALVSQVGNYVITHPGTGKYTITFPYGVSQYPIVLMSAGLNPISNFITSLNPLTISVTEFFSDATTPVDGGFNFIVVGPHN